MIVENKSSTKNLLNLKQHFTMKKITLLLLATIAALQVMAQKGNLVLFAEQGERFTVIMNGIQQNATPQTNVAIRNMPQAMYLVKIIFEDKNLGVIDDKINIMAGFERNFNIRRKKQNADAPSPTPVYVIRAVGSTPIADDAPPPVPSETVIVYHDAPVATTVSQTTTTTTTTGGDNANSNMGVNGMGINMNVNGLDGASTTTTRTTTVTQTSTNDGVVAYEPPSPPHRTVYVEGYNGPIGCPMPMSAADFQGAKSSIASKSFEESKLQVAKQIVGANCCTAEQVKAIMRLFSFEESRLDFAKFAYKYTYDQKNYYKVNDAFQFESSISDLNAAIGQ